MNKKTIIEVTRKDIIQVRKRLMAKAFILIDRCQKKEKGQFLHLWDENKWKGIVYLIDTNYKDTKDENIKELKRFALELVKLEEYFLEFAEEFLEAMLKGVREWKMLAGKRFIEKYGVKEKEKGKKAINKKRLGGENV